MDHQFASSIPFNSTDNDPDQPFHIDCVPTIPYKGVHATQSFETMPALGDVNYLGPGRPMSTYAYRAVSGIQQGLASMHQVVVSNSSTPFRDDGYQHQPQQTFMPDTRLLLYDDKHSFHHDEDWTQFAFSTANSKPLQTSDQPEISPPPPTEPSPSKKCEWKGCTFPRPFRRDAELIRHIRTIHISRDAYKCPVCGRGFGRKDKMTDHRRTHSATFIPFVDGPDNTRQIMRRPDDTAYMPSLMDNCNLGDVEHIPR